MSSMYLDHSGRPTEGRFSMAYRGVASDGETYYVEIYFTSAAYIVERLAELRADNDADTLTFSFGVMPAGTPFVDTDWVDTSEELIAIAARVPASGGYVVMPHGGYPDVATDYVHCATRAEVEAQLVDYGWMDNPGVFVYRVQRTELAAQVILELSSSPDPYPDWVVERGPRGGVQWNRA